MNDIVHRNKRGNLEINVHMLELYFNIMLDAAMTKEEVMWITKNIKKTLNSTNSNKIKEVGKYKWS